MGKLKNHKCKTKDYKVKVFKVKASIENYQMCRDFIEHQLNEIGLEQKTIFKVLTACEEIIVNVMNYAYSSGEGDIEIAFVEGKDYISIKVIDSGTPFNPFAAPEVNVNLTLDEREVGGLGILMVKELMDDVEYEYIDNKNVLTIIKRIE